MFGPLGGFGLFGPLGGFGLFGPGFLGAGPFRSLGLCGLLGLFGPFGLLGGLGLGLLGCCESCARENALSSEAPLFGAAAANAPMATNAIDHPIPRRCIINSLLDLRLMNDAEHSNRELCVGWFDLKL